MVRRPAPDAATPGLSCGGLQFNNINIVAADFDPRSHRKLGMTWIWGEPAFRCLMPHMLVRSANSAAIRLLHHGISQDAFAV